MESSKFQFEEASWASRFQESVWHEFSGLARKYGAVNLGQGFPNFPPPDFVAESVTKALTTPGIHTYARPNGNMHLVNVLSKMYSAILKKDLNPETQFQITTGASGAIFVTMLAITNPGDEVIVLAPWFDLYDGAIAAAGGKTIEVPLRFKENATSSADWKLDINELKNAITPKTKCIILNSPHNPTGKMFSATELNEIADVVRENNKIIVLSDEVYEFLVYEEFQRFCLIPGMWERTINISSAGKIFATTGWKIGWVYGPVNLVDSVARVHQFAAFSVSSVLQEAIALSFERAFELDYFKDLVKQQTLFQILSDAGLNPLTPQGAFYIVADISKVKMNPEWGTDPEKSITKQNFDKKDWNFCRWLTAEKGVAAIPCSAFFYGKDVPSNMVRFAFCKTDEDLKKASELFSKIKFL